MSALPFTFFSKKGVSGPLNPSDVVENSSGEGKTVEVILQEKYPALQPATDASLLPSQDMSDLHVDLVYPVFLEQITGPAIFDQLPYARMVVHDLRVLMPLAGAAFAILSVLPHPDLLSAML